MGAADTINEEITGYLVKLNYQQKKAVLTVVKTFADEQEQYDPWEDESFLSELDERTAEYENGTAELCTLDELETEARDSYKTGKRKVK
jgi:hypothetical protein